MSRAGSPFKARTVLALLLVGALSFLVLLFALGQGWTGQTDRNGGEHAASNGLTGFAGLAQLLEARGHQVVLGRSAAQHDDFNLLVLTPSHFTDAEEVSEILVERQEADAGPTLLILPKWQSFAIPPQVDVEAEKGWVVLGDPIPARWFAQMDFAEGAEVVVGETRGWSGSGRRGSLAKPQQAQALTERGATPLTPIVVDSEGDVLVAEYGRLRGDSEWDSAPWPVLVVFEPDLMNNLGLADRERASLAIGEVEGLVQDNDLPIVFDLTLPGLGQTENLLTLAFRPPFLAATLCLLLAALVIAWRAMLRFGPAVAEAPAMARGKRQLARNGAALVAQLKRFHLLKEPYEALVERRISRGLGLRSKDRAEREAAIARALDAKGRPGGEFAAASAALRDADGAREIVRAARDLKSIERTLQR